MIEILSEAVSWIPAPEDVQVLADITSGGDGTSNGAILSLVFKLQLALGALLVGVFMWRVFGAYASKPGGNGPGGGGGGGGGRDKTLVDELKYFAIACAFIVAAYPITDIILSIAGGATSNN